MSGVPSKNRAALGAEETWPAVVDPEAEDLGEAGGRSSYIFLYLIPALIFVSTSWIAVLESRALERHDAVQMRKIVSGQLAAFVAQLETELQLRNEALLRMAQRTSANDGAGTQAWRVDARSYLAAFPELDAIVLRDFNDKIYASVQRSPQVLHWLPSTTVVGVSASPGAAMRGRYVLQPRFPLRGGGFLVAQGGLSDLVSTVGARFEDAGYVVAVQAADGTHICCDRAKQSLNKIWAQTSGINIMSRRFEVSISPKVETIALIGSDLSLAPLIAGPVIAALLALAFHLLWASRFRAARLRREIAQRRSVELDLKKLSRAVEQSSSSILITDPEGLIEYVNSGYCSATGFDRSERMGEGSRTFFSDTMGTPTSTEFKTTLARGEVWAGDVSHRTKSGALRWSNVSVSPITDRSGRITHFVEVRSDISERRAMAEHLQQLAYFDTLTTLPNRLFLKERFERELNHAQRRDRALAIMFIDLDNFKTVNDTLGHEAGDRLLQTVAQRLNKAVRDDDLVVRMGGDEFVVVLVDLRDASDVEQVANNILKALRAPITVAGQELFISGSIGASLFPRDGEDLDGLCKAADVAMYEAKARGRNTYALYNGAMDAEAMRHLTMNAELRHALERGEFEVHYQPQVDCADRQILGAEALLRWTSHTFGSVSPAEFVPLLESAGLIGDVGTWVLQEVFAQVVSWRRRGLPRIIWSINVSGRQLQHAGFTDLVKALMAAAHIDLEVDLLEFEVTESVLMAKIDHAVKVLSTLSGLGVSIAIDDFGTGYSSLSYIKQLPLDVLKIDRSFVRDIATNDDALALVRAIVLMARALRLAVVPEGIEDEMQLELLQNEDCHRAQGYLFARPMLAAELEVFAQRHVERED